MKLIKFSCFLMVLTWCLHLFASDGVSQDRLNKLMEELRCPKCENQSIFDSDALISQDIRLLIEDLAAQGKSDQEIKDFLQHRYGSFILYDPPLNATTLILWTLPWVFVLVGIAGLVYFIRKHSK